MLKALKENYLTKSNIYILGLHIKFMTASILPQSLDVLTDVMSQSADVINVPVFVEVNVLEASKESTQPLVRDPEQVIMKISQVNFLQF